MDFQKAISTEELNLLSPSHFDGNIVLIEKKTDLKYLKKIFQNASIVGFDTETKPNFKKGNTRNGVALLQLSTLNTAVLIRINKIGLPNEVIEIFKNPKITKAGLAIRDDIRILQKITPFETNNFVDIQTVAKEMGIENISLKKLAAIVLNIRISKSQQLSDWEATTLTDLQKIYAATDAWVCYKIFEQFSKQ